MLTGSEWMELQRKIINKYTTTDELRIMVKEKLGGNLSEITESSSLTSNVFNLIQWCEARGRLGDIIEQWKCTKNASCYYHQCLIWCMATLHLLWNSHVWTTPTLCKDRRMNIVLTQHDIWWSCVILKGFTWILPYTLTVTISSMAGYINGHGRNHK